MPVAVLEKLIALGAAMVLALGWCGSLQAQAPIGAVILPEAAVSGDGTSRYYFPTEDSHSPHPLLLAHLQQTLERADLPFCRGRVWTTDAFYRETVDLLRGHQAQGVLGVEMELAALFAVGRFRQVPVAGLLLVSDELATMSWQPAYRSKALWQRFRKVPTRGGAAHPDGRGALGWRTCLKVPFWPWTSGGGTQDLFIWEPGQTVENAVKMVLPAPTQILARRLARLSEAGRSIFLKGRLMGGGAIGGAVRRHLAQGLPLYATAQAALTFSDRLEAVEGWGVVLTETPPPEAVSLSLGDVDLEALGRVLADFEVPLPRHFAVAVQDHGFAPRESNRRFRFQYWEDFLARGGRLRDLAFRQPPARFTRMLAVAESLPGAVLMDTCAAGVRGALIDPQAREHLDAGLTGGQPGQCPHLCRSGPGRPSPGHL